MPIRNGTYETRNADGIFDSLAQELQIIESSANPRSESTYTYALLLAAARTSAFNQEQSLKNVYNAAYVQDATGENLTKKARELGFIRQPPTNATGVVTFSRENIATTDYVIPAGTIVETLDTDPIQFETTEPVTLESGSTTVQTTVEAVEPGSSGNVGPNTIQAIPSPPTGIGSVNNNQETGNSTILDTTGTPLVVGRDEEDDESLRDRVLNTDATEEGPSPAGIKLAVEQTVDVLSVTVNTNQTDTVVDGLDPYTTEVVVYGGDVTQIAVTLSEAMSVTTLLRLQGGVNGTREATTITIDLLEQDVTIPITRPPIEQLEMEIDVVHTGNYAGSVPAKDAVVQYIGGTYADDSTTTGLFIEEDVLLNKIENNIEDVEGVEYADVTVVDGNGDGTDDSTTTENNVPVYEVSESSLARIDADDITVTETPV